MFARILAFGVLLLAGSQADAGGKPITLEPASKWVLDYGPNNCRLLRTFGSSKTPVGLVFEQMAPHATITVLVSGGAPVQSDDNVLSFDPLPGVRLENGQRLETVGTGTSVAFWPKRLGRGRWGFVSSQALTKIWQDDLKTSVTSPAAPYEAAASRLAWNDHDWHVQASDKREAEDQAFSARADQVTAVTLNPGRSGSLTLHTGPLGKAFQALEQCTSDSLKAWGIDPIVEKTVAVSAHPATDERHSFASEDYPAAALSALKESNVQAWLNIDQRGAVTSCRVISDYASPEINNTICDIIRRREKFVAARTKDGTPVPSFYIQTFEFRIEHS